MAKVALLGTGVMGAPMARNLAQAGDDVRVWNRTKSRAEGLGAKVCDTPSEAAKGAEFLITMLADASATQHAATAETLGALAKDGVWLQMGTIGVAATEACHSRARLGAVPFVDAPVLGTKAPAEKGELTVIASGPEALHERCEPIFGAVGKKTLWVGDEAGAAQKLKLIVNNWVFTIVEAVGEGIAFAQKLGLDPQSFLDTLEGSQIDTPYLHSKGGAILAGDFEPSFKLRLAEKDVGLVLEAATAAGARLPLTEAVREQFLRAIELGHGEEDQAAAYFASAE